MPYEPTTNFKDSNGVDLGDKLVTKDYLLTVYPSIVESIGNSNLTVSPALWTWGRGNNGELGTNNTDNRNTPVTTLAGGTNWKQVSVGQVHMAGIKSDGTLWTWGWNGDGQLGTNDLNQRNIPVTTIAGGTNWKQVCAGRKTTAAIKTDGTLWIWGWNYLGFLGINVNDGIDRLTPVTTFAGGTNWKFVSTEYEQTAAIKTDGTLWTWGYEGRCGTNDTITKITPVTTFAGGTNWKYIACGQQSSFGIKTDGTLWCWGSNSYLFLGTNDATNRLIPVTTFAGGTNWKQISSRRDGVVDDAVSANGQTAAVKTDGTLWVWGRNGYAQLGINASGGRSTPVTTFAGGINWKQVCVGGASMFALKTDGTLWCWGYNKSRGIYGVAGDLGLNDTITRSTPVTIFLGGNDWKSLAQNSVWSTAAIKSNDYI